MLVESWPLLLAGFSLGLLHALDADHIMAVSLLSTEKSGLKKILRQSVHWAIGHSGILLLSAALLFGLHIEIPISIQHSAELLVGVMLVVMGLWCFYQTRKYRLVLSTHRHGDIEHTHWQVESDQHSKVNTPHKATLVGMLHGLAGSASALALVPALLSGHWWSAFFYLVVFSLGVLLSMLAFAVGFAKLQHIVTQHYHRGFYLIRQLLAFGAIALGSFWLVQAV